MQKPVVKIIIQFIFFELLFLFTVNLGLVFLPHQDIDLIYYVHINLYFLIACFSFLNFKHGKLDRFLIFLFFMSAGLLTTISLYSFFAWTQYEIAFDNQYYLFYNLLYILINTLYLFISTYLFLYIKKPFKKLPFHLLTSVGVTALISFIIYFSFFNSGQIFEYSSDNLFSTRNKIFLLNFTILLLFWYEYSKQKHNLSEYLTNIIVIYTVIVGFEIVHIFLIKNDLEILHNLGQYFTAILNLLMLIIWLFRLNYLQSPQSKENEYYIKNYKVLYGFVEKPRTGMFERFYHTFNPRIIWTFILFISLTGSILFLFNHFNLFVKKNILLLIISLIISTVFAIMYWNKRWYQAIEFLIKKKKN